MGKSSEIAEEKKFDFMTEERLHELLSILFPYGYSHHRGTFYTGVSPYIGTESNIITIVANDPNWSGCVFSICMDKFSDNEDEENSLGFYKGIMKVIAPELYCNDDKFEGASNVIDFDWAVDHIQWNAFPVEVKYKAKER
jgi:hypothetical protein